MFKKIFSYFYLPIYGSLFFLTLISTSWLYWQGLEGVFIFDDIVNLESLNRIDETAGFKDLLRFVLEGKSSSLGRPVSLLTFALQADSWPFSPWDFKYVNLMIHLLNGCLVFWFIFLLTGFMGLAEKRRFLLALLTTALWLWHPLQVSTVLYVIQRMTELAALFTLVGLLFYLQGRQQLAQNKPKLGFFLVSLGVVSGGILATLSKENGILLVLYILVLEATVLRGLPKPRYWSAWRGIFLYLPLLLLTFYFITHIDSLLRTYEIRNFTLGERLLTQARVLMDYLGKILLIKPYGFGLFHDDYPISHGLLTPPTTLLAILALIVLVIIAIRVRYTLPIVALSILWFLAGHILESSFIGLLLYFEHRNYLPMLGIIFAVSYGVLLLFDYILTPYLRKVAIFLSLIFLALLQFTTWSQTNLWGNPFQHTILWAQQHPQSPIAQSHAVVFFKNMGETNEAIKYAQQMVKSFPTHTAPYLYLMDLACSSDQINRPDSQKMINHFKTSEYNQATLPLLAMILVKWDQGECHLEPNMMDKIFQALIHNSNNSLYQPYYYQSYALFHIIQKQYGLAVQALSQALALKDSPSLRLEQIRWLIADQQFAAAQQALQKFGAEVNPIKVYLYDKKLKLFEQQIQTLQEFSDMDFTIYEEK